MQGLLHLCRPRAWESPSLWLPSVSSTSLRPRQFQGTSHQSTCSNIKTRMDRHKSVVGVIRGATERLSMSAFFLFDHQVLACTESATSEYSSSTSSHRHCLSALLGRPGRVKFILDGLRWGKINQHTFRAKITSKVDRDSYVYIYIYIYIFWRNLCYDSWSLSHLGYLYPGTVPVMIKLDHNRSCPWV